MVVQHNMQAMNANRMLNVTTGAQAKSTEKLSSGYKINRAADDAAGLSISEKMRKQIRGLDQASSNAQDGVSAVQTAEGALTEVHSMLQRMNELAVQAANGTNSESDRQSIQDEIDQLTTEIDRVAETTKFNETYLLKGNVDGTESDIKVNAHDAGLKGNLIDNGNTAEFALSKELANGDKVTIAGKEYTIGSNASKTGTDGYATYNDVKDVKLSAGDSVTTNNGTYTLVDKIAAANNWEADTKFTITDEKGNTTEYTVAAATNIAQGKIAATDVPDLLKDHLANPDHKVTMTAYKATGGAAVAVNAEVVSALGTNEKSMVTLKNKNVEGFATGTADDGGLAGVATDVKSVTVGGKETIITAKKPVSASDIADVVGSMRAGDKLKVGTTDIEIADKTDVQNGKYTVADALKAINVNEGDMDTVEFAIQTSNTNGIKALTDKGITNSDLNTAGNAVTVVGSTQSTSNANTITAAEAYQKMADELQKASSIGTDNGKEAKVTNQENGKFTITKGTAKVTDALSFSLHVGADADMTNKINVDIESMSAAGLGIKGLNVKDDTGIAATYAIDAIADAVSKVSAQRSALGAVQNRLEHTIANVDNVVENTTSAESRIRDTDMAETMVEYSKNNILAQAGQSMLAQANQSNQGVLSLLQ